jgi:hypothetical protein
MEGIFAYNTTALPVPTANSIRLVCRGPNRTMHCPMGDMLRASLEAEILTLCHQLNVLRRKLPKRLTFSNFDRLIFAALYRFA